MKKKLKTHKAAAKRFKLTGGGLKHKRANKNHNFTKRPMKPKRQLRGTALLQGGDEKLAKRMLRLR